MVNEEHPWMVRGGGFNNPTHAGVFYFSYTGIAGEANNYRTFRLVISPSL